MIQICGNIMMVCGTIVVVFITLSIIASIFR